LIATTRMRPDDFSEDMENIAKGYVPPPDLQVEEDQEDQTTPSEDQKDQTTPSEDN